MCRHPAQSRMCPANHRSAYLLPLSHLSPTSVSLWSNGLHAAFASTPDVCLGIPSGPCDRIPTTTTSHQHQRPLLPPDTHAAENQSHQQPRPAEKTNVAVLNQPEMQRKIKRAFPYKERKREGKCGWILNRLERCPNHWKLVIGLCFTLPPEK